MCKDLLAELLGGGKSAERAYAIQVRGSSGFGLFKGMLMGKNLSADEPPIQIPQSMLKLGPSRASDPEEKGFLVITTNGVHPNTTNQMMGRLLSGVGTTKTIRKQSVEQKQFSPMIYQLWVGLKVPRHVCDEYIRASKKEENLQHAFVVGLTDPTTGGLPHSSVFVPGLRRQGDLFVTRSPCIETTNGRLVPVVSAKPDDMSKESWNFLESLPFGSIVF